MKLKSSILLFAFAFFFVEMIGLPIQYSKPGNRKAACCIRVMSCAKKCGEQKTKSPKPAGKCNNNGACVSCPVCSQFTGRPSFTEPSETPLLQVKFNTGVQGKLFNYHAEIWKPPDHYFFSI